MNIKELICLKEVDQNNWRDVYKLDVKENQKDYVAAPGYYLNLCSFGGTWNPLAIYLGDTVIGFTMWAIDSDDNSCWLGGLIIDKEYQRKGYGKRAIQAALSKLGSEEKPACFALSYSPDNRAKSLYQSLGFEETGEMEDDEVVARLAL